MSIVVDASVLIAALIDSGPEGKWAEEIVAAGSLHAPELARAEAANVLRRLERGKLISPSEAHAAYEDLIDLNVETYGFDTFSNRVWELRHTVTSYDGWYVALAEALASPLATLDHRLSRAQGPTCRFLTPHK